MTLRDMGWDDGLAHAFSSCKKKGWIPARLVRDHKIAYGALLEGGEEIEVILSGKVYHDAETDAELPAVGDWVALDLGGEGEEHVIRERLPRRTCFSRKAPGKSTEEQVMVANVDEAVVVTEPGADFNLRRIERYLTLIARSGAEGTIFINKGDLFSEEERADAIAEIHRIEPDVQVEVTSACDETFENPLAERLRQGRTMMLIGSSGVGKSSLVNRLLGNDALWTSTVNEVTGKGRHTTTTRSLIVLPGRGILVDNPGIREVHLWTDEKTLRERFADIDAMALQCRFSDCKHGSDAGCAIREALAEGTLDRGRYEAYLKLDDEIASLKRRRKKRQMTLERRAKRDHKIKARNLADRIEIEADEHPSWR